MIAFTVHLDLEADAHDDIGHADRLRLRDVENIPDGARLVVHVGSRQWPSADVVRIFRAAEDRLLVEVVASSPHIVASWHAAVTGHEPPTLGWTGWSA